ncbi:hypothetical protein KCV07_g6872, partial [Aureobasidium melanogenum]
MSEPFSDKEKSNMDTALQSSRSTMPFIEEDDDVGTKIKTEDASQKRPREEDDARDVKKPKEMYYDEELAYNGKPVQKYDGEIPYNYNVHERLPQHEVNSAHHKRNINFHGKTLSQSLLAELEKYRRQDQELEGFLKNFIRKNEFRKPGAIRFGVIGNTGTGKSTLINLLLSAGSLSTVSAASKSCTQVAIILANALQEGKNFIIFVSIFHVATITNLLSHCLSDIMAFVLASEEERKEPDFLDTREDANAALIVLKNLIPSRKAEFRTLKEAERYLTNNPLVQQNDTSKLLIELLDLVKQRATAEGIDWENRWKHDTAVSAEDAKRKIETFSKQQGLAAIVNEITIRFSSALLAQGIELVDLPGLNDRNTIMREAAIQVLRRCHKIIVVTKMDRSVSDDSVKHLLDIAIKMKGVENVMLVIRGREEFDEEPLEDDNDVSREEFDALTSLQKELDKAIRVRDDLLSESPRNSSAYEKQVQRVNQLEHKQYLLRLDIRDDMWQRDFANRYECLTGKSLLLLTVSHLAYKDHLAGTARSRHLYLTVEQTKIPKFRALMCAEHSDAEVDGFKQVLESQKKQAQQLIICLEPENMPSRFYVLAIFNGQITISLQEERDKLQKGLEVIRSELDRIFETKWQDCLTEKFKVYDEINGGTIGACIKKKGVHKPSNKPEIRMNHDFANGVEGHLLRSKKAFLDLIRDLLSLVIEKVRGYVRDLGSRLKQSDHTGPIDLDLILSLLASYEAACVKSIERLCRVFEKNVVAAISRATADQVITAKDPPSAFVVSMNLVYEECYATFPPKCKGKGNLTKKRLEFLEKTLRQKTGPFSDLANEITDKLDEACAEWVSQINKRVEKMRGELRKVLSNSFEGKKMSAKERAKIAPSLRAVAEKFIRDIDNMLAMYKNDDSLFVAQ